MHIDQDWVPVMTEKYIGRARKVEREGKKLRREISGLFMRCHDLRC